MDETITLKEELDIVIDREIERERCSRINGVRNLIKEQCHFAQDQGGALYYYKNGVYLQGGEKSVAIAAKQIWDHLYNSVGYSRSKVTDLQSYFAIDAPRLLDKPAPDKLNLLNGIYNLTAKTLEPHDPKYRTTIQLQVNYDPNAACPEWDKFISEVFEESDRQVAYEIVAWLMTPFTSSQKSVVLLGTGANGKSVFLNGVTNFLGRSNTCNIPLQKLADRFTTTQLIGKLANISPDLPNTKIASTSEFKSLTGGDELLGEYKHGAIFSFKPFARCLFACNELPETPDNSDGFYRRLNVICFEKQFEDNPLEGARLNKVLGSHSELSGLLNRAIEVLPSVLRKGITITERMSTIIEEHRKENDPVSVWFDEYTVSNTYNEKGEAKQEQGEFFIPMTELFQSYRGSGSGGQASKNAVAFGKCLKRYRPKVNKKQKRIDGEAVWCYVGIRLKTDVEDIDWQASDIGNERRVN